MGFDGTEEHVFRQEGGEMIRVDSSLNRGTFDFASSDLNIAHLFMDVLPWLIRGNDPGDAAATTFEQRLNVSADLVASSINEIRGSSASETPRGTDRTARTPWTSPRSPAATWSSTSEAAIR